VIHASRRALLKTAGVAIAGSPFLTTLSFAQAPPPMTTTPLIKLANVALAQTINNVKAGKLKGTDLAQMSGVLSAVFASWQGDGTLAKLQSAVTPEAIANFDLNLAVYRQQLFTWSKSSGANVQLSDFDQFTIDRSTVSSNVSESLAGIISYFNRAAEALSASAAKPPTEGHYKKAYFNTCTFLGATVLLYGAIVAVFFGPEFLVLAALAGLVGAGYEFVGEYVERMSIDLC
jgi:hypothetical protein